LAVVGALCFLFVEQVTHPEKEVVAVYSCPFLGEPVSPVAAITFFLGVVQVGCASVCMEHKNMA